MPTPPRRHRIRRAGRFARCAVGVGVATFALALAGCGTPPTTSAPPPAAIPTAGVNVSAADHSVAINNLFVPAPGGAGYQARAVIPLSMSVWNNTNAEVALTGATVDGHPLELLGGVTATATVFSITVPASGNVTLDTTAGRYLRIACLTTELPAGSLLPITFTFSNKATIRTQVPVGSLSPGATLAVISAPAC